MLLCWLAASVLSLSVVKALQRCHVCVSGSSTVEVEHLFPGTFLVSCHDTTEVRVCPDNYKGCLTQKKEIGGQTQVTRTCAQLAVDSCMAANGVEYCYCTGQMCNTPGSADDEDLAEGSGEYTSMSSTIPYTPPSPPVLPSSTAAFMLSAPLCCTAIVLVTASSYSTIQL